MAQSESDPTLCFNAKFPFDEQFVSTVAELASRLALSAGLTEDEAGALAKSVGEAFTKALNGQSFVDEAGIDVSLCAGANGLDASVVCGATRLLTVNLPKPHVSS